MWPIIWGVIIFFSLFVEIGTAALVSIWFAIGAIVALILSLCNLPVFLQILSFVVVSGVCFYFAWKHVIRKKPEKTNHSSSLLGKRAMVTETIDYSKGTGKVSVNGQYWKAIPQDKEKIIKKNTMVIITEVGITSVFVEEEVLNDEEKPVKERVIEETEKEVEKE